MFKNYLTIAIRNLTRHKAYTFINIIGLAIGLAFSTLILLYLQREFSYDRRHTNVDRIYKMIRRIRSAEGATTYSWSTVGALAPALGEEFPEIERATRFLHRQLWVNPGNNEPLPGRMLIVDEEFLKVFDYPLLAGDQATSLRTPYSAFVTQEYAAKLFGNADPIGKKVWLKGKWSDNEYTISGLLENGPQTSLPEFRADMITATFPVTESAPWQKQQVLEQWTSYPYAFTYVVVSANASIPELGRKLPDFAQQHLRADGANTVDYVLTPLTDIHLYSGQELSLSTYLGNYGDLQACYRLGLIGILLCRLPVSIL